MSEHKATIKWERGGAEFSYQKYPRDHAWSFDGGHTMTASAAPAYLGNQCRPEGGIRRVIVELSYADISGDRVPAEVRARCVRGSRRRPYGEECAGQNGHNARGVAAADRVEWRSNAQRRRARQDASCGARELLHCQFGQDRHNGGESIAPPRTALASNHIRRHPRTERSAGAGEPVITAANCKSRWMGFGRDLDLG